jgi:3-hydroxybutyryl-CoA dehydrogenase
MRDLSQAKIAVIGAGTMGIGIAQLAASHGHSTYLYDVDSKHTQTAVVDLKQQLAARVAKGKLTQAAYEATLGNLTVVEHIEQLSDRDLVIEAIVEKLDVKQALFAQLASICAKDTIFASNTSSISITALAAKVPESQRVIGLHFFNPAPVMKLVEIICGLQTQVELADALQALMQTWKKVPVRAKSTPGFIVNRVARPFYAEGLRALQEQVTRPEVLDYVLRECGGFAMGPCQLTDLIGQDVNFSVTQSVYRAFYDEPRYRPSLVQQELVDAGFLGRKTGQGFYHYQAAQVTPQYVPTVLQSIAPQQIQVHGAWLAQPEFLARLKHSSLKLDFNSAAQNVIIVDDIQITLTDGSSLELNIDGQKRVFMDWHHAWDKAQAIALSAYACDDTDLAKINALFLGLNVTPVWLPDYPGLLCLRTISCLVNEACETVLHAVANKQDIDLAMKYGVNYPMGPFAWAEKISYNTILKTLENMYHVYKEEKYRPSRYLRKKAALETAQQQKLMDYRQAG